MPDTESADPLKVLNLESGSSAFGSYGSRILEIWKRIKSWILLEDQKESGSFFPTDPANSCWCPVRSLTKILQCILSSLLINRTYLLLCPSKQSWLIPYLPQTFCSVCVLFSIQFPVLNLYLLKDICRKSSRPILILTPSLASLCVVLFCCAYILVSWFSFNSAVSFSIQFTTSSNFVSLTARDGIAAWLPVQISKSR